MDHQSASVARQPYLQEHVMRNCHEPGERWTPEDGMVLRGPVDDFKLNFFSLKFEGLPKMTWRCINPRGYIGFPGTMPWKDVLEGRRSASGIFIFCSVSAYMRLMLLPPSINTFFVV
jgi:hypothetical protein